MNADEREGDASRFVGGPNLEVRKTADDAQWAFAETLSDADENASTSEQRSTGIGQLASDRDQAAADRQHAAGVHLTPADRKAYEPSRDGRGAVTVARHVNPVRRARTARCRDATVVRSRLAETDGRGGRARDARFVVGQNAFDALEISRGPRTR